MTVFQPPSRRARRRHPLRDGRLLIAGSFLAVAACAGTDSGEEALRASDETPTIVRVRNPLPGADLATLSHESDAVVHGTVEAVESDVQIGPPNLTYSVFTIDVDEVLVGDGTDTVEVAAATGSRGHPINVEGRPDLPDVGDAAVWFLSELAPEFGRDGYVMTSPESLLVIDDDGAVDAHDEHTHAESVALAEADELGSEDAVLDHLRSVSTAAE
jgi:hypothetical protein